MDHLHSFRWRSFDKTLTIKSSWQNINVHVWQNIYAHYDEEIMTKHLRRRNHDKAYTLITMKKSWQNIYDEEVLTKHLRSCLTKHIRSLRWRSLDKTFTMKKSWQSIYVHVWHIHLHSLRWRNHDKTYTMKKSWKFNEVRKEVRSNHLP